MRKAFTLLELIVCVAIIAVLVALIFAAGARSVDSAKTTVCISNLRQIHAAALLYQSDHGEFPPNNITYPGFLTYLGGKPLLCPLNRDSKPSMNYAFNMSWPDFYPEKSVRLECREKRAAAFPLALDYNHQSPLLQKTTEERFLIVLRLGGAVEKIPLAKARAQKEAADRPCPLSNPIDNY